MKFIRLTSVFLCCALLSSFLVLPVSASDDSNYYSLPPVGGSEPSTASLYPVTPSATGDGWSSSDSDRLRDIWQALTDSSSGHSGSIAYCIWWIWNYLKDDIRSSLGNIDRNSSVTASRILDSNSLLGSINTAVSGINGFATESSLSKLVGTFSTAKYDIGPKYADFGDFLYSVFGGYSTAFPIVSNVRGGFNAVLGNISSALSDTGTQVYASSNLTLYQMVKFLQETLASEDDRQLSENYKDNREQAEQDFLSGQSGKTSLGKDDFGSLSSVGGTFKDTISLNGQSSLSDLTSGLSDADSAGQGWFSQATKDSLDSVSGSGSSESTVSTFSDDGLSSVDVDPDPYHMQGFEDNYAWLWGDDDG